MSATEKALEVSVPSIDFDNWALMITVPNDHEKTYFGTKLALWFFSKYYSFTELESFLHDFSAFLNDEMEIQETSTSVPLTVIHDSKSLQKINFQHLNLQSRRKKTIFQLTPHF